MNASAAWEFRAFNFPVRVHISFLFVTILLGFSAGSLLLILAWVPIVFFSILLHELGHAFVSRYYGRDPRIELYSMGGLTISTRNMLLSYPKEIFISFAGPLAGFILGGIVFAASRLFGLGQYGVTSLIVSQILWVNIGWGIINLVPILPLDGGHIMENLYHWLGNPYDQRTPLKISIGFGILGVIAALVILGRSGLFLALLVGWLTFNNYQALRAGYWTDTFI